MFKTASTWVPNWPTWEVPKCTTWAHGSRRRATADRSWLIDAQELIGNATADMRCAMEHLVHPARPHTQYRIHQTDIWWACQARGS